MMRHDELLGLIGLEDWNRLYPDYLTKPFMLPDDPEALRRMYAYRDLADAGKRARQARYDGHQFHEPTSDWLDRRKGYLAGKSAEDGMMRAKYSAPHIPGQEKTAEALQLQSASGAQDWLDRRKGYLAGESAEDGMMRAKYSAPHIPGQEKTAEAFHVRGASGTPDWLERQNAYLARKAAENAMRRGRYDGHRIAGAGRTAGDPAPATDRDGSAAKGAATVGNANGGQSPGAARGAGRGIPDLDRAEALILKLFGNDDSAMQAIRTRDESARAALRNAVTSERADALERAYTEAMREREEKEAEKTRKAEQAAKEEEKRVAAEARIRELAKTADEAYSRAYDASKKGKVLQDVTMIDYNSLKTARDELARAGGGTSKYDALISEIEAKMGDPTTDETDNKVLSELTRKRSEIVDMPTGTYAQRVARNAKAKEFNAELDAAKLADGTPVRGNKIQAIEEVKPGRSPAANKALMEELIDTKRKFNKEIEEYGFAKQETIAALQDEKFRAVNNGNLVEITASYIPFDIYGKEGKEPGYDKKNGKKEDKE